VKLPGRCVALQERVQELEALAQDRTSECEELTSLLQQLERKFQSLQRVVIADDQLNQTSAELMASFKTIRVLKEQLGETKN